MAPSTATATKWSFETKAGAVGFFLVSAQIAWAVWSGR